MVAKETGKEKKYEKAEEKKEGAIKIPLRLLTKLLH